MRQSRTVMFALAAQGEYLLLLRSSLAAVANLLCLGADHGPLPRLGICALELAAKTGKVHLKVKLRPSELSLYDFHAAALKIKPTSKQQDSQDPVEGAQAVLALRSLSQVLLQDASHSQANKTIVLITDHLMPASDFQTYLSTETGRKISLKIIVLCDAGAAGETAAAACDWEEAEATHPGLTVQIVEVGGKLAVQTVARALLATCASSFEGSLAPMPVSLEFPLPFLGNYRSLQLEVHREIRPLNLSLSHCIVCACHSAPLALHGALSDAYNSSAATPLSLTFRCPVSGNVLPPTQCVQDGRAICVGNTAAGVLHSSTPISIAGSTSFLHSEINGSGGVLRVLSKINMASTNSSLIIGPSITLKPNSNVSSTAAVKVAIDGEIVSVNQRQLLTLVANGLRAKNQALMVESGHDLQSGRSGLFKFQYMLVPAQNSSGAVFCAMRLASLEELAPQAVPAASSTSGGGFRGTTEAPLSPPLEVVTAIESLLGKVPEEANTAIPRSSRVHETLDILIGEACPPPKAAAGAGVATGGSGGGNGDGSGKGAVAGAPAVAAGGGGGRGGRGAGNRIAPQSAGIKSGRGGKGGAAAAAAAAQHRRRFAVVQPVADHTKLELSNDGLSVLRSIKGLVAPIVVIGPYRSGKSFTLNQLLGVGCDEGFGVGHTRNTQTKGVWVWGQPIPVKSPTGETINILLFDTEGFESTGKADSYDDRIFALSTLISSVLIYNLPESIRESDVEKLSFAAELAKAFYTSTSNGSNESKDGAAQKDTPIRPGSMVWLIQRDFLQGATLKKTLQTALNTVPNPHKDPAITQLNRIRQGLAAITGNSTALGLPQPHLDRTRLCEIPDEELDPGYLQKREELKAFTMESALPKVVKGKALDGPGLADLISQVVTALNDRDIPTAGSLVEYFNKELVEACRAQFVNSLEEVAIPVEESILETTAETARNTAIGKFEKERFGSAVESLREILDAALNRELSSRKTSNTYESSRVCEAAELECETALEREAAQKLPSTGRFEARYQKCKTSFDQHCIGPAKQHNIERLQKAWERESSRFNRDYNERLYNGLVLMAVAAIVVFRFVVRWSLGETAGWCVFLFLQLYPKSFLGTGSSMYETATWQSLIGVWEIVIDNPVIDLQRWGTFSFVFIVVLILNRQRVTWWVGKCCGRRRSGSGGRGGRSKTVANRDLDV